MIGAGSVVFSKNLTADILTFPHFSGAAFPIARNRRAAVSRVL